MAKKKQDKIENRAALDAPQTAAIGWIDQPSHPALGLTPQRLAQLLIEAESGNLTAQADLGADMEERDGHIFSEVDKRKKAINGLPWQILPPKNASAQEKKIAEEVAEWIDDIPDLEMIFFDAMDAVLHGYSCQTIEWHQLGKLWLPARFEHCLAREFKTPFNAPNELRWNDHSVEGAEFWDYGWFNHRHKAKSGYVSRSGLLRVLCYPYLFKNYGIKDILEFLEIYGLPIRVGSYSEGATEQEKRTLLRAVLSIGRDAGGIIPKGMTIDFKNAASGDTDNHMSLIKWCENTQSKVIVGGTLLSQADGKTSTNAQSKTHEVQFETLNKSDAKQLARSINDSIISYVMRLNYPNITPDRYPSFKFDTTDTEDLETFSKSLPNLVNSGMRIGTAWAHERAGIPIANDDEPILTFAKSSTLQAANHQQGFKLAALTQQVKNEIFQDQIELDDAINQLDSGQLNAHAQVMIQTVLKQLEAAKTIDDALGIIANMLPDRSADQLQEHLAKLLFAAETWGAISVQAEL